MGEDMRLKCFFHVGSFIRLVIFVIAMWVTSTACTTSSVGSDATSCADGSNDFYVVENASCVDGDGKLSRVNLDAVCKEEILTNLNCPVDFVLSTVDSGIGYLSSRTDGILQVDLNAATTTSIATTTTIVSPAGLFLLENMTEDEREGPCGGNTLVDAILMIADEGTDADGGMVWRWCLITDDPDILSGGTNPSPVSEVGPAQIKHPRGVVIVDRTQVYATGVLAATDDAEEYAALSTWELNEAEIIVPTFLTAAGDFSDNVKDISKDSDGTLLIADPDSETVFRYDIGTDTLTGVTGFTGGPRDILPIGIDSYFVSQFDDGNVLQTALVDGSDITNATEGLTLSGPNGMAQ
jgi:hypothetical protein